MVYIEYDTFNKPPAFQSALSHIAFLFQRLFDQFDQMNRHLAVRLHDVTQQTFGISSGCIFFGINTNNDHLRSI